MESTLHPGLIIRLLVSAMASIVSPRYSVCSSPILGEYSDFRLVYDIGAVVLPPSYFEDDYIAVFFQIVLESQGRDHLSNQLG